MKKLILITFALFAFLVQATAQETNTEQEQKIDAFMDAKFRAVKVLIMGSFMETWVAEEILKEMLDEMSDEDLDAFSNWIETYFPGNLVRPKKVKDGRIVLPEEIVRWSRFWYFTPFEIYIFIRDSSLRINIPKGCYSVFSDRSEHHFCINEKGQIDGESATITFDCSHFEQTVTETFLFENGRFVSYKIVGENGRVLEEAFKTDSILTRISHEECPVMVGLSTKIISTQNNLLYLVYFSRSGRYEQRECFATATVTAYLDGRIIWRQIRNDPTYRSIVKYFDEDGNLYKRVYGERRRAIADD